MERQFCINWSATVEEAKERRKAQRLTQARLAAIAGVSTPTLSRFERGAKDIQLFSVMSILTALGMIDQRDLIFPEKNERDDASRMKVLFNGKDGDKIIQCSISHEALQDHFDQDGKDILTTFRANRKSIEHRARRKYCAENMEADGSILLQSRDIG